jgi:hypothetical protein
MAPLTCAVTRSQLGLTNREGLGGPLASLRLAPYECAMQDVDWGAYAATSFRPRRTSAEEFRRLPLVVHSVLDDVPLQDVTFVDLPNGGSGRTVADVSALTPGGPRSAANSVTRMLFAIRGFFGRLFHWDGPGTRHHSDSYRDRIAPAILARSHAAVRAESGPLKTLYELDNESLAEGRNATVHAFMSVALLPRGEGYRLYWAVYVKPVSRFTPLYMAIIEPFRRFVVYPSILGGVRRAWALRYATATNTHS